MNEINRKKVQFTTTKSFFIIRNRMRCGLEWNFIVKLPYQTLIERSLSPYLVSQVFVISDMENVIGDKPFRSVLLQLFAGCLQ